VSCCGGASCRRPKIRRLLTDYSTHSKANTSQAHDAKPVFVFLGSKFNASGRDQLPFSLSLSSHLLALHPAVGDGPAARAQLQADLFLTPTARVLAIPLAARVAAWGALPPRHLLGRERFKMLPTARHSYLGCPYARLPSSHRWLAQAQRLKRFLKSSFCRIQEVTQRWEQIVPGRHHR